jgi:hypothetical protein
MRLKRRHVLWALALFLSGGSCQPKEPEALRTPAVEHEVFAEQCLRFDQPLGYSSSGDRERGDSAWHVLQLRDGGAVERPFFPERQRQMWSNRSRWSRDGLTLTIRVSDGLVGWDLSLAPDGRGGLGGVATYLTDVIVAGWVPPRMNVQATTIKCPAT